MNKTLAVLLTASVLVAGAAPSHATMPIMKKAKEAGFPAANCLYCHNEKLPVKGKMTHNERGTFLVEHKATSKVKEVDVTCLKEFVETKK